MVKIIVRENVTLDLEDLEDLEGPLEDIALLIEGLIDAAFKKYVSQLRKCAKPVT